jgi:hypothetical protein
MEPDIQCIIDMLPEDILIFICNRYLSALNIMNMIVLSKKYDAAGIYHCRSEIENLSFF